MEVYGLIGDPVEHSLSPPMFEAGFSAAGIDATYVPFRVLNGRVAAALAGAGALGIAGLNVTIPHKEAVLDHATPTDSAAAIGAANVLTFDGDRPAADNTDAAAMAAVLDRIDQPPATALVLGAGGAARAYVHTLDVAGWTVTIANRTRDRADRLAGQYESASAIGLDGVDEAASSADLVLNATTVGFDTDRSLLSAEVFRSTQTVIDAVYRPRQTRLLTDAAAAGADTISGLTLLLEQAVAAFERWRPEPVPRSAMADALETGLSR